MQNIQPDDHLTNEQRGDQMNRLLYKILNEIEQRIILLPSSTEPPTGDYFDETFERFYQAYVTSLISLHDLYTMASQKWLTPEFEAQINLFKEQLTVCFQLQREFCNGHRFFVWNQLRTSQIHKMTKFGFENKGYLAAAMSFYSHMLYNLGVLAARLQVTMGFYFDTRNNKGFTKADLIQPLLQMVYSMVEMLLSDSIICTEPSQNPILVTNNLFPTKVVSLCRCTLFKRFQFQIISEEVAQQIQQEMRHRRTFDAPAARPPDALGRPSGFVPFLLPSDQLGRSAMKPSSGVKRNNATASAEGGNTAHKKSDVSSKEWISIPPSYDPATQSWTGNYPHLLCTTRQKDALLDTRSAGQTGKRPLFYFHVKAEVFGFTGGVFNAHTLSMPFAIATRRNQDCQVQRMMSSYTATCFWLFGTAILDDLLLQWYDNGIDWKHFKNLYAQYFSMNAEVKRTLTESDFEVLENKMQCPDCEERIMNTTAGQQPNAPQQQPMAPYQPQPGTPVITFKNVLCPHLQYKTGKLDVKFSVWRGMLELLHLFSDQKTELRKLWECGLLQGFIEKSNRVHSLLAEVDSAIIIHLSFIVGGCVLFVVKSGGQILNLEPLDLKRLQSKSLYEYLRDVMIAEKIEFVLNADHEWIRMEEAMKLCKKADDVQLQSSPIEREITSNVVSGDKTEIPSLPTYTNEEMEVINTLNRKSLTAAAAVASPVQPPISCVHLPAANGAASTSQLQPVYNYPAATHHHSPSLPPNDLQQNGFRNAGLMTSNGVQQTNGAQVPIARRWDELKPNGQLSLGVHQANGFSVWPHSSTPLEFADADKLLTSASAALDPALRFSSS
ncbi:hypothetical protein M3Y99_00556600 [Aphelenchoides fujianensis]|nr:hypothetical protein M3Y99_00556600 [Aphelenchoides fujianensis]